MRVVLAMLKVKMAFIGFILAFSVAPALGESDALFTTVSMTPDTALKLALETQRDCRKKNYQVSVAVLDRSGVVQVLLRDRYAGAMTPDIAEGKARTALNLGFDTIDVLDGTKAGTRASGIRHVPGIVIIAGGVRVMAAGSVVGAVGVSGGPGGDADDGCARAGIEAITDMLNF